MELNSFLRSILFLSSKSLCEAQIGHRCSRHRRGSGDKPFPMWAAECLENNASPCSNDNFVTSITSQQCLFTRSTKQSSVATFTVIFHAFMHFLPYLMNCFGLLFELQIETWNKRGVIKNSSGLFCLGDFQLVW